MPLDHVKNDDASSIIRNDIISTDEATIKSYEEDNSVSDMNNQREAKETPTTVEIEQERQQQQQPYSIYSKSQKLLITFMVSCAGIISPFSGTIYYPALKPISESFEVSTSLVNLSITVYMVFQGVSPLFWGPCSDLYGRRPIYLCTMTIFIGACIALANTPSFPILLVLRMLQAFGASSGMAIGAGVIGDITTPAERGAYYSIFTSFALSSTAIGPVIGGVITNELSWRWIFWILLMIGSVGLITVLFFLPETLRALVGNGSIQANPTPSQWIKQKRLLRQNADKKTQLPSSFLSENNTTKNSNSRFKKLPGFVESFMVLRYPDVILIMIINGCFMAMLFTFMTTTPAYFSTIYNLNTLQVGLCYIPYGAGSVVGSFTTGRFVVDRDFRIIARKYGMDPEQVRKTGKLALDFPIYRARLRTVWIQMVICQIIIITYGWTLHVQAHLAVPLVLQFIGGASIASVMNVCQTLVIDLFPGKGATITATSNLVRSIFGAIATATIQPGIDRVGLGWLFSIIGLILTLTNSFIPILIKFGPSWWSKRVERREREAQRQQQKKKQGAEG
ncbi:major facilitator superfamily domain-containing protein [Circinella umbellata]|nr:major facilitator superfamily domain-containing protein [Circinella umbellata]